MLFFPNYDFAFAFFSELYASHKAVVYKGLNMRYVCCIRGIAGSLKNRVRVIVAGEVNITA